MPIILIIAGQGADRTSEALCENVPEALGLAEAPLEFSSITRALLVSARDYLRSLESGVSSAVGLRQ